MKNVTMTRAMVGGVLLLALMGAAGNVDAAQRKLWSVDMSVPMRWVVDLRVSPASLNEPIRYPEDTQRRELSSGQRSLWNWVQALATAPLM